jgi:hypothetical protein
MSGGSKRTGGASSANAKCRHAGASWEVGEVGEAVSLTRGCAVSVVYFHEDHERYRLLELLGCEVFKFSSETEKSRFVGVLSDADDNTRRNGFIRRNHR